MIAKKLRLPRQKFFTKPLGQKGSGYFLIKIFKNELGRNRFGVVIGTRVDKRSSRRHFWKRTILDYMKHQPNLSQDFLIIASPRLRELSRSGVERELKRISENIKQYLND